MTPGDEQREKLRWFLSTEDADSRHPTMGGLEEDAGAPPPSPKDRKIGKYRLVELIGEGGMGVVFRARDEELGREVALKMLKTAQAYSAGQIERFQREARNTARLRHPGIATLYETGRDGDTVYLCLELIRGRAFDPKSGDLPSRTALLEKVARAVQYAHEQGVIHRDLKPGNILVGPDGEPHLLDFGLSRDLEQPSQLTRSGAFFGTPSYAAPEQAAGKVHELDARTDVYSLGAILYEALTGAAPFTGASIAEILQKVSVEEPAPPAGPVELRTICLKALEKDPARRYRSAGALADDLGRYLRGEPIEARPMSRTARAFRSARKHRAVLIPAALALAFGAAAGLWIARPTPPAGIAFDDFEQLPYGWKYVAGEEFPGAKGGLALDDAVAHGGRRSYRLDADFAAGGGYVGSQRSMKPLEGREFQEIRIWIKAVNLSSLGVQLIDHTNQCHQRYLPLPRTSEWQELVLKRSEVVGGEHWGGANDATWHGPILSFGLNIGREHLVDKGSARGAYWIDDIVVIPLTK